MRILAVNAISFVGGAEEWLLHLVRGLAPRGHRIEVAHDPRSPLGRRAREAGANTIALTAMGRFVEKEVDV